MRRLSLLLIISLVAAYVAVPTAALAQSAIDDPSAAQYEPPIPDDEEGEERAGTGASTGAGGGGGGGLDSNIGSLPFTGMDLIIVAGVAFVLTGTGFALRRLSTPPGPRA